MAWLNNDGLNIKFGVEEGHSVTDAGSYATLGNETVAEMEIRLADLTDSSAVQSDVFILPAGAMIKEVEVLTVETALTGTSIDIGLIASDRKTATVTYGSTAVDVDAVVDGHAIADMDIGESVVWRLGVETPSATGAAGAAVGAILVNPCLVTALYPTGSAFTAGKIRVKFRLVQNAAAANQFQAG